MAESKKRRGRAIVYVAWGKPYIEQAMTSAATAAIVGVDRLLITNAASRQFLRSDAPFERVIEHEFQLPGQGKLAKSEMFDLLPDEYGSFVFLDTDTHVLLDIDQGFERAELHGIAMAPAPHYGLEHFGGFGRFIDRMNFQSRELLHYNSGVIFFTRVPDAWRVFQKWHQLCVEAKDDPCRTWGDQPYLTFAMELLKFNPYTLSIAYNYRNFGEYVSGRIRIWHSHMPPPADVNKFDLAWPPRRFRHGLRLEDFEAASIRATP